MPDITANVPDIINQIKAAIEHANAQKTGLMVSSFELSLKATLQEEATAGGVFQWLVQVGAEGKYANSSTQTIEMSFKTADLGKMGAKEVQPIREQLTQAIELISQSVRDVKRSPPQYDLDTAKITLEFTINAEGQVKVVFAAGSLKRDNVHTITLNLE